MQVVGVRALSDVPGTHFPRDSVAPADQRLSDQPLQLAAFQEVQLPSIQHCQRVLARGARPKVPASCIAVTVDGETTALAGTVAQVGPVQSGSSGYTYPTIIALPATSQGLHSGSTANVSITTGEASNVLAVPTSAVTTQGTNSYVLVLSSGTTKQKQIKVGIVGDIYTQVTPDFREATRWCWPTTQTQCPHRTRRRLVDWAPREGSAEMPASWVARPPRGLEGADSGAG
jgi:hypothetical protein